MEEKILTVEDIIHRNTVPSMTFPILFKRHHEQLCMPNLSESLHLIQQHETYMYTFFSILKLDITQKITIDAIKNPIDGVAVASIQMENISFVNEITPDYFYEFLLEAPLSFVFVPDEVHKSMSLCNGGYSFISGSNKGVLMDIEFAIKVGVDFIAADYINKKDIYSVYIGFIA
jgi:hypothetical protein